MADTIWNNNYLLSNLDAQKLYAQSPLTTGVSGTSAYIGIEPSARYNETVLWDSYGAGTSAATLSESMTNFEKLKILLGNQNAADGVEWHEYIADPSRIVNLWYCAGGGSNFYFICLYCSGNTNTNITINKEAAIFKAFGNTSVNGQAEQASYKNCIHKVVGINRKEV